MANDKNFSYEALTATAEKKIVEFMAKSTATDNDFEKQMFRSWAYGVYAYWYEVTSGRKKDGDAERLEALTE